MGRSFQGQWTKGKKGYYKEGTREKTEEERRVGGGGSRKSGNGVR